MKPGPSAGQIVGAVAYVAAAVSALVLILIVTHMGGC